MTDLKEIHIRSFGKAMREIVIPTLDAGGDEADVLAVLESTITGVLLALYRDPRMAARMLEESLVPQVIGRISDHAARRGNP